MVIIIGNVHHPLSLNIRGGTASKECLSSYLAIHEIIIYQICNRSMFK